MLALQPDKGSRVRYTPNVLPCRVDRNGPVNASERYWAPATEDGKTTAYFRGRKLHGKSVRIPEKYRGIVAYTTDRALRENAVQDANGMDMRESAGAAREEEDEQDVEEVQILQESGSFSEILVWGHEAEAEDENDPYLKGMQEWISFAETLHAYPSSDETKAPGNT